MQHIYYAIHNILNNTLNYTEIRVYLLELDQARRKDRQTNRIQKHFPNSFERVKQIFRKKS